MDDAVIKFCQFRAVPTLGSAYKVASNALQFIDIGTTALGTSDKFLLSIFVTTIHASVTVVIDRAIAYVVLVHEVNDIHNSLRIVGSVSINLNIENMSATSEVVIWGLNLGLVLG